MLTEDDLLNRFTYHAPKGTAPYRFEQMREFALGFARQINTFCPAGREKSTALTKLEEVVMWANAAIARNPDGMP